MKRSRLSAAERRERAEIRETVFRRDGYRCRLDTPLTAGRVGPCYGMLTPHHIRKASQGGAYVEGNLMTLCQFHNDWVEDNPNTAHALGLVKRAGE